MKGSGPEHRVEAGHGEPTLATVAGRPGERDWAPIVRLVTGARRNLTAGSSAPFVDRSIPPAAFDPSKRMSAGSDPRGFFPRDHPFALRSSIRQRAPRDGVAARSVSEDRA